MSVIGPLLRAPDDPIFRYTYLARRVSALMWRILKRAEQQNPEINLSEFNMFAAGPCESNGHQFPTGILRLNFKFHVFPNGLQKQFVGAKFYLTAADVHRAVRMQYFGTGNPNVTQTDLRDAIRYALQEDGISEFTPSNESYDPNAV